MSSAPLMLISVRRVHGRVELTLSTGELLCMPRAMLRERPSRGGSPFDRDGFDAFLLERGYAFAMDKAVSLLASRARTEKEITDALHKNAYPEPVIARVMARLQDAGYLDDAQFAGQWAAARTQKGLGARRIRMELRQKGVDADTIDEAVCALDADTLAASAFKAAEKAARGKDLALPADRQKILAALARRGFDFSQAKRAVQHLTEQAD